MGFTKLDEGILQSSIMAEDSDTFKIWIALLAACKEDGIAYVSPAYLSSICRIPIEKVLSSLDKFLNPDELSRSTADDGRRIVRIDGGYKLINYHSYRERTLRGAEAERKRVYREKLRELSDVSGHSQECPDASASASASSSLNLRIKIKDHKTINFNRDLNTWENIDDAKKALWSRAYPACDIDVELARMVTWILENPEKGHKTRWGRFIVNWLGRSQDRGGTRKGGPSGEYRASQVGRTPKREASADEIAATEAARERAVARARLRRRLMDENREKMDTLNAAGNGVGVREIIDAIERQVEASGGGEI